LRAPARIAGGHLSDKRRTRGRGSTRRPRASAPEGATACLVPAEDGRRLDEQRGVAPRRRHACCEPHREALPRCPPDPPRDLSLRDDELLPKQGVLGDETGAAAHDVGGQPHHEPKDLDHAARCTAVSVRMPFVARTVATRHDQGPVVLVRASPYRRTRMMVPQGPLTTSPGSAMTLLSGLWQITTSSGWPSTAFMIVSPMKEPMRTSCPSPPMSSERPWALL